MQSIQRAIFIVLFLFFYENTIVSARVLQEIIPTICPDHMAANASSKPKATAQNPEKKKAKASVKKTTAKKSLPKKASTKPTVKKNISPNSSAAKNNLPQASPKMVAVKDSVQAAPMKKNVKQAATKNKADYSKLDSLTARTITAHQDSMAAAAQTLPAEQEEPGKKYTIQICTLTSPIDDPFFTGKYAIRLIRIGDLYRYIYSSYTTIKSARADLPKIRKIYPEAFIRELQDNGKLGKAIDMKIDMNQLH